MTDIEDTASEALDDQTIEQESAIAAEGGEVTEPETPETSETGEGSESTESDENVNATLQAKLNAANAQAKAERKKRHIAEGLLQDGAAVDQESVERLVQQQVQAALAGESQQQQQEQLEETFIAKLDDAATRHKDVDLGAAMDRVGTAIMGHSPDQGVGLEIGNLIKGLDAPWDVIAKLDKDPELLRKVMSRGTAAGAALELGRIEVSNSPKPTKKLTQAPEPTVDVDGPSSIGVDLDDPGLSQEAYEAALKKQLGGSVYPQR